MRCDCWEGKWGKKQRDQGAKIQCLTVTSTQVAASKNIVGSRELALSPPKIMEEVQSDEITDWSLKAENPWSGFGVRNFSSTFLTPARGDPLARLLGSVQSNTVQRSLRKRALHPLSQHCRDNKKSKHSLSLLRVGSKGQEET